MERILVFVFIIFATSYSIKAQTDSLDPRRKAASPTLPQKNPNQSKVLLDTSFNPGTKKGDSLLDTKKKKPASTKKKTGKAHYNIDPGFKPRDTTYRAK